MYVSDALIRCYPARRVADLKHLVSFSLVSLQFNRIQSALVESTSRVTMQYYLLIQATFLCIG